MRKSFKSSCYLRVSKGNIVFEAKELEKKTQQKWFSWSELHFNSNRILYISIFDLNKSDVVIN